MDSVEPGHGYQRIADVIEQAIVSGELRPGDHLPSERDLVERFHVSRSTVREALRLLSSFGLVRSTRGDPRGPRVLPISADPLRRTMLRFAGMHANSFGTLVQFRMIMESSANLLAARHRGHEHLRALEEANTRMRDSLGDSHEDFSEADFVFHQTVARASGNPLLEVCGQAVRETTLKLIQTKLLDAADQRRQRELSLEHHDEVLAAIRDQDGPHAAWLARERLYTYYRDYVEEPDRAGLRALVDEFPPQAPTDHT